MKLDWIDFNIGLIVLTKKGQGMIKLIDKPNNSIGVLLEGKIEKFGIDEIGMPLGSLSINLTQQIGQYVLLFQRVENRLRDFTNGALGLNEVQKTELTTFFTAGKLIDKINSLIKKYSNPEIVEIWKRVSVKLKDLNKIRNTIVHGYLFHYSKSGELDFKNIKIENANGNIELLDFEKLYELNVRASNLHQSINNFMIFYAKTIEDNIKNYR
ncbi:hypothetical protein FNB79_11960 [Formosa sediminum]|uniref:Uncharacterized protein n=1 Tax=Formosa sediminum TaxID=2594004 RepID=A0A516GSZ6_9FLAO|nr:hypothetical protein [Formosa sediminum]QDO94642.1 hypothetical protein FNB79_11960 [Formosa sediminum]